MILSASRRSDIPCFYSDWLMNRLRAGYALSRNPVVPSHINRVMLSAQNIDCIVFWTKDPAPMLDKLPELDRLGYMYYFQFTVTPYGRDIEPGLRCKDEIAHTFAELSRALGRERVRWRYDPVILNDGMDVLYHKRNFLLLCERLSEFTESVTISFVDRYAKLKTGLFRDIRPEEIEELGEFIGRTARAFGLEARACCESGDMRKYGISPAACIDASLVQRICGKMMSLKADKNQRPGCGCCESFDIGAYDTCLNGCVYCYANHGQDASKRSRSLHDPSGELLAGIPGPGDTITDRREGK